MAKMDGQTTSALSPVVLFVFCLLLFHHEVFYVLLSDSPLLAFFWFASSRSLLSRAHGPRIVTKFGFFPILPLFRTIYCDNMPLRLLSPISLTPCRQSLRLLLHVSLSLLSSSSVFALGAGPARLRPSRRAPAPGWCLAALGPHARARTHTHIRRIRFT